jgi:TonB dependent receptor/Carboxypeptidase regulatory-like domain/TonB-dependent Receptor Plug Domain
LQNNINSYNMKKTLSLLFVLINMAVMAQNTSPTGIISGSVKDKNTQIAVADVLVTLAKTNYSAKTNEAGDYELAVPVGTYEIVISRVGYNTQTQFNIIVNSGAAQFLNFELEKKNNTIDEIKITSNKNKKNSAVVADLITPLSVQRLTATEIKSNPGGNFDISRVVQALPGVAGNTGGGGFRNDIIIRGGAPNENVFYLDGIEIPVINHFQTQGGSGGPAGILNVSFIEDVKLSSSAFDAKYDNVLSSAFAFKQRNGNSKKISGNIRLSGTELATTFEGPLSPKTTFLASGRRSYLQFLFKLIDLPIRPDFYDFQYKTNTKINDKTTLTFLGVGAIDEFYTVAPKKSTPENEYILRSVPYITQWNYTTGASLKKLITDGYYNISLSRNMFDNKIDQFENKQLGNEAYRALRLRSQEIENKLRFDINKFVNNWKWSAGVTGQYVKFNNDLYTKITNDIIDSNNNIIVPKRFINSYTNLDFFKLGVFGQVSRRFLNEKLGVNFGLRTDMNSFTTTGNNPLKTLSPRASISYALAPKWNISASAGSYYKIPVYTVLGFKDTGNNYVNKNVDYTKSNHLVAGVEFLPKESFRVTAEVFYKQYSNYLVGKNSGISLANQGADFNAIGNEAVTSTGDGNTYGFEIFVQQKLIKRLFTTLSYTFVRSQFSGSNGVLLPSAWDSRHLFSGIMGYKFNRNWELGAKIRVTGGSPYTPFNIAASRITYPISGKGVLDYNAINSLRLAPFAQFDFRIDKKYNFKNKTLDIFLDVANASVYKNETIPSFVFKRNAANTDFETTDGKALALDGNNGIPVTNKGSSGLTTPTIGFILEF